MNYEILISFLGASMLLTIMPGPDIIYVLVQSISNGKKHGIATTLGLVSGILIHTSLVAFGVSALIKQSESIYFIIKLFGALYLIYLAMLTYKSSNELKLTEVSKDKSLIKLYKQGFVMNVLNPKVSLFFLAFFPGFLYSTEQNVVVQFYVLGLLFMFQAFLIFGTVAFISGSLATFFANNPNFNVKIKWFKILVFVGLAIFILFS